MTIRLWKENGARCHIEYWPKNAGETFTFNDIVSVDNNGDLIKMADATNVKPVGLIQATISSSDSDYNSTTRTAVLVCGKDAEFLCDIGNGAGALTVVGEFIDLDGNDNPHQNVDVSNSDYDVMEVTGHISTTQLLAKFNVVTGVTKTGPA